MKIRGGVGEGGGERPQGFDPLPCRPKGSAFVLFELSIFGDPEIVLKAPLEPIYTNFEGGARAEKRDF